MVSDDIREQTRVCFQIIGKELEAAGATLDDICDMTVFLRDIENHKWPVREVRSEFFEDDRPAGVDHDRGVQFRHRGNAHRDRRHSGDVRRGPGRAGAGP